MPGMRIEEEIQQQQFATPAEKTLVNLVFTVNWLNERLDAALRPHGVTQRQYNILRILRGQQGKSICLEDIKGRMLDRNPDVSRLVERMRAAGLLDRTTNPDNRRRVEVRITQAGLDLLNDVEHLVKQSYAPLTQLGESEHAVINQLLDRLRT
jgi:DNA-binding MarR family transcriptional regulator